MKIVLQRVKQAAVEVNNQTVGKINKGVCLLIGVEKGDTEEEALSLAHKVTELRIFPDKEGKMNLSLLDIQGEVLAVSQFTLAASLKKGRRPGFDNAEDPERAENLFRFFVDMIKEKGIKVETGVFGALMDVHLVNDGPVTFILDKKKLP
jgi:D-tyrosyl-tRNA(Tyr) deacylase